MSFKEVAIDDCGLNFIPEFRDHYVLISAANQGKTNQLTAAWVQTGHVWQLPICLAYIRPPRYTREFMEKSGRFTVAFFDEDYKQDLMYLGSHSGREVENKIENTSLHLDYYEGDPVYEEAKAVLICRTIYVQQLDLDCYIDKSIPETYYAEPGMVSYQYYGEIEKVLVKE